MCQTKDRYLQLHYAIMDLNKAWHLLDEIIKHSDGKSVFLHYAYEYSIVCYCKPFLGSHVTWGDQPKSRRKNVLKEEDIPLNYIKFHKEILGLRHQFLAHSDLSEQGIKFLDGSSIFSKNMVQYPETDKFKLMVEAVLDRVYPEYDGLEAKLDNQK